MARKSKKEFVPKAIGPQPIDMQQVEARPPAKSDSVWERAETDGRPALIDQEVLLGPGRVPMGQVVEEVEEKLQLQDAISESLQTGEAMSLEPVLCVPKMRKGKAMSGKAWLHRVRKAEYAGEAIDFIRDVWRGTKTFMVTYFDPKGGADHIAAYPSIQQRLDAAKFLASKSIPAPAPELPKELPDGIRGILLVTSNNDPPV
jgi:hypothetical protein